jgi:hypothetical protein
MGGLYTETEAETIRAFVRARQSQKKRDLAVRLKAARRDCDAIVSAIAREYRPLRISQWGSLVNDRHFSETSDIVAVETALLRISYGFVPACSPTSPTAC